MRFQVGPAGVVGWIMRMGGNLAVGRVVLLVIECEGRFGFGGRG